ncbi:DNA alkylation repair protein [Aliikangiella sp. IMCC44359]|uniref:DNA alkylation repair protein n=1 Tax=Aliikangiella sp. IMCC44359 TaxID=3459125 RepID=UPI00403AF04D
MPELLKHQFSEEFVFTLAKEFKREFSVFKEKAFIQSVFNDKWETLELKDRMRHLAEQLGDYLPSDYEQAVAIILPVADKFSGMQHILFPEYIERFGLNNFKLSMKALEHLTSNSSSEFAIRPFILRYPKQAMEQMEKWSRSKNEHIRRLASEGCRPRLPWAMALPEFKQNPAPLLEILERLVSDDSLYVRRSVANNLNDISKDNPDIVINFARTYLGHSKKVDWAIKHACRGLLKQGHKEILLLFGFEDPQHLSVTGLKAEKEVAFGGKVNFEFKIKSKRKSLGKLRLEFIIEFMKANGKRSAKIFKISEGDFIEKLKIVSKSFSFKSISTRRYYPGIHRLIIVINGKQLANLSFKLLE